MVVPRMVTQAYRQLQIIFDHHYLPNRDVILAKNIRDRPHIIHSVSSDDFCFSW